MKTVSRVAAFAMALATLAFAVSASAKTVVITDVETGNGDLGNVFVGGYGAPWTTPILMTDAHGHTYVVFCDDLNHDVNVGGGQMIDYTIGPVIVNGLGQPISEAVSNEMGQLADIGRYDFGKGNEDGAIAAQAAIWGLEYDTPVSSSDATIEADITNDLTVKDNGGGYATGFISANGIQNQILGGVPEPDAWALMILGLGAIGLALRSQRRRVAFA